MSGQIDNLYRVQKQDVPRAGVVLADAFQHDPIWQKFFKPETRIDQRGVLFESPIKFGLKYGAVYAPSERLEGIALWVPGDSADMTVWRLIRSGAIISGMKAMSVCTDLARKPGQILGPLEVDRNAHMKGRSYIYLMILGVATECQEQGFGTKLLSALIEESERARVPIYVETETERNVSMYERSGFRVIDQVPLPIIDLPQWEMVREPGT